MIHLHVHSHYSLLDGIIKIPDLIVQAKELGMTAIALTDHGSIAGWIELQQECTKQGVKPIFGIEAYCCVDTDDKKTYHTTLLAKNNDGLKEIIWLHNLGTLKQFYRKPRITYEQILQCNNIVVLSGCMGSFLSQHILHNELNIAKEWIQTFSNKFDEDFYIELQDLNMPELDRIRETIWNEFPNYKICITNDVHYLTKQDADAHHIFMCGQFHKKVDELHRTPSEMWLKPVIEGYKDNVTYEIADKCNAEIIPYKRTLPPAPKRVFLQDRITKENREQIRKEYDVIKKAGFFDYFCIVADYIEWCRQNDIMVGISRGSCGGSVLAYAMGIHGLDPIKYKLFFSRFYNEGRKESMPDIDTDFPQNGIEKVKEYLRSKYQLSGMATYGTMNTRGALKFVARTLNIPFQVANEISKKYGELELSSIPRDGLDIATSECLDLAEKYIGLFDKFGQHASGYIITYLDLEHEVPLRLSNNNEIQTCWDMRHLEWLGFVKFDLLKIKTLDIISEAMKLADCEIKWDDLETYETISEGKNVGIFQLAGSAGISDLAQRIKPRSIEDLAVIVALYRPGPLENNVHNDYVARRNGAQTTYLHKFLKPILSSTYGLLTYQEQIISICLSVGFSEARADEIRKVMGKKKPELLNEIEPEFLEKCEKITGKKLAKELWDQMCKFAHYSFNLCLTGDTKLRRHNVNPHTSEWDLTIQEYWDIKHSNTATSAKYRDPKRGLNIEGINTDYTRTHKTKIKNIYQNGIKDVFEIETKSGKSIKATENHLFPTYIEGELVTKKTKDLSINDTFIITDFQYEKFINNGIYNVTNSDIPNGVRQAVNTKGLIGFQNGKNSISYVNGQHILLNKNSKKLKNLNSCQLCGTTPKRIEIHHKDGNRKNNNISNLIALCVSCHKKADYQLGRKKRGDKGYPINLDPIISITYVGKEMTYDIEVESDNHLFFANGIATHNSHSIGYSYLTYITAYLKTHYPLAFYTALFNNTNDSSDIQEYINDMKPIELLPPRHTKSQMKFTIEDDKIRYGLGGIYGIGSKEAQKILEQGEKLLRSKSELSSVLIKGGYFDEIEPNRKLLVTGNLSKRPTKFLINEPPDFTDEEKKQYEFDLLHVYLDTNPLGHYKYSVYRGNKYESGIRIMVIVKSYTTKKNMKGRNYAIVETININNKIDKFFVFNNRYDAIKLEIGGHYILTIDVFNDRWHILFAERIDHGIR